MILDGSYKPGDKLPPERELASQFGTSRPSVRAALHKLEAQGFIRRVQGGGNYVSDKVGAALTDPLLDLFEERDDFKYDLLEYRHALEGAACYLAAQRANDDDKKKIKQAYDAWLKVFKEEAGPEIESKADLDFHLSIAEASHSVVFPHAMRQTLDLIRHSVTTNLKGIYAQGERKDEVARQHLNMMEAIFNGDAEAARDAVRTHLDLVQEEFERSDIRALREKRFRRKT